jgi:peroxiredoxin Q/BCP
MAKKKSAVKKAAKKSTKRATTKKAVKKKVAKTAAKKATARKAAAKKSTATQTTKKTAKKKAAKKTTAAPAAMPKVGHFAPDFELVDGDRQAHRLSDYRGRKVVLYFYPRDNTPGCTKEACGFRDTQKEFAKLNTVVLGVSPDTPQSHTSFAQKFKLNFPLLADPEHAVAEQYGAWGEKNMYGKKSFGIIRSTFIIDEDGKIEHVYPKVKADGHEQEVLNYLQD